MGKRANGVGAKARAKVVAFLAGRDWTSSLDLIAAIAGVEQLTRTDVAAAVTILHSQGRLLRQGKPPRGYSYRLKPDLPLDDDGAAAPSLHGSTALPYEAPALRRGPLVPSVGLRVDQLQGAQEVAFG